MTFQPVKPTQAGPTSGAPNSPAGNEQPGLNAIVRALQLGGQPIGQRAETEATLMQGPQAQLNSIANTDAETRAKVQTPMAQVLLNGLQPQEGVQLSPQGKKVQPAGSTKQSSPLDPMQQGVF